MTPASASVQARPLATWALPLALLGVFCVLVLRCLSSFAGAGHDDTFITLFAAESLADGRGFVTPDGVPGEIGSSLLHVLLLALAQWLNVPDLFLFNKALGLASSLAALALILVRAPLLFPSPKPLLQAFVACVLVAWLPTFAFWTMGGLEAPLVGLLLVWLAIELSDESPQAERRSGYAATLLVLTRPEGFAYLGTVLLVGLVTGRTRRFWQRALLVPLSAFALVTTLRWLLIGYPFPLPVMAKAGGGSFSNKLLDGLCYVLGFAQGSWFGAAAIGAMYVRFVTQLAQARTGFPLTGPRGLLVPTVIALNVVGACVVAGGDWMAFHRFLAPAVPLLGIILVQSVWQLLGRVQMPQRWQMAPALAILCAAPWLTHEVSDEQFPHAHNTSLQTSIADLWDPAKGDSFGLRVRRLNHPYQRDESQLLPFLQGPLKEALSDGNELTIASLQMGFLPYHLRLLGLSRVKLIDTVGIVDPSLAHLPGERSPFGLTIGATPHRFLDPNSSDPVARAIQARKPDILYVLYSEERTVQILAQWGWRLIWSREEAKIYARSGLAIRGDETLRVRGDDAQMVSSDAP